MSARLSLGVLSDSGYVVSPVSGSGGVDMLSPNFALMAASNSACRIFIDWLFISDGVRCLSVCIHMTSPVIVNTHCDIIEPVFRDEPSTRPRRWYCIGNLAPSIR